MKNKFSSEDYLSLRNYADICVREIDRLSIINILDKYQYTSCFTSVIFKVRVINDPFLDNFKLLKVIAICYEIMRQAEGDSENGKLYIQFKRMDEMNTKYDELCTKTLNL